MIWQQTARQAVAHLRKRSAGTGELAVLCGIDASFLDDALAPLVDAGKLMRINAFRNGAAEFDYRFSATWVPVNADFELCKGGGHAPRAAISPVAPPAPGKLEQRGAVASTPAHVARPVLRDDHVANGKSGARSKTARDALERAFTQPPQSLGWAPAPSRAPQPAAADHPDQESAMSTITRKPRRPAADSIRYRICKALALHACTRDQLISVLDGELKQLSNVLFQLRTEKRISRTETADGPSFSLTPLGRKYLAKCDGPTQPIVMARKRDALDKSNRALHDQIEKLATRATGATGAVQLVQEQSFRCAVYSDGGFSLTKAGQAIELTAVEHAQMLRYLERMAEQAA